MIYVRKPNEQERIELRKMARHEIGRVSQRATIILLSGRNKPVPAIAEFFGTSRATVRLWIHRFNQYGTAGLYDTPRSGRPNNVPAIQII